MSDRPSKDRPLSVAQERALDAIREYNDQWGPDAMTKPQGVSKATLEVLDRLGLVRVRTLTSTEVAKITDDGRAMLNSMGD